MKIIAKHNNNYVLRFDKGENVIDGLIKFCTDKHINSGHFTGLGACGLVTLAYYDLPRKEYLDRTFSEDMEIVSLTGNIALMEEKPIIHCHGVFSDYNYHTFAGHVKELIVSTTCEIHLTVLTGEMKRGFDEETGLNLLK